MAKRITVTPRQVEAAKGILELDNILDRASDPAVRLIANAKPRAVSNSSLKPGEVLFELEVEREDGTKVRRTTAITEQSVQAARVEIIALHAACRDDAREDMVVRIAQTRLPDDLAPWTAPVATYWTIRPEGRMAQRLWTAQRNWRARKEQQ